MNISILCTDAEHPVQSYLQRWAKKMQNKNHKVSLCLDKSELTSGDVLFLVSCGQIIKNERSMYKKTLVLHASDLPEGRGWSPHIWSIIGGKNTIVLSLLEASDKVDTGDIWFKKQINLEGHELLPEINKQLFEAEIELMSRAIENFETTIPTAQTLLNTDTLPKRTPHDSEIDPEKSVAEQFNLLRTVDNKRFPAFFYYRNQTYKLTIEKYNEQP